LTDLDFDLRKPQPRKVHCVLNDFRGRPAIAATAHPSVLP
jgi:hypothetical protein